MTTATYAIHIFIAGDLAVIRATCRQFCLAGLCVTVTPTEYVFTGGSETGASVGLINYARFPAEPADLSAKALALAKSQCFSLLREAGVDLPIRYKQGFKNNNCICCVKATSLAYWVLERRLNPEVFARRAEQSRRFGARLTRWRGERIFLDEIPPDQDIPKRFLKPPTENVSCGPECGVPLSVEVTDTSL